MQSIQLANLNIVGHFPEPSAQSIQELRKFGEAARYMVSPTANMGKPPLPDFVLPLGEARAEWCTSTVADRDGCWLRVKG